jgi:hypothetical protein
MTLKLSLSGLELAPTIAIFLVSFNNFFKFIITKYMFYLLVVLGYINIFPKTSIIMNEQTNQMKDPAKGMAVASMVCGICSLVFIFVPFLNLNFSYRSGSSRTCSNVQY